ncbi:uncharacterized protein [Euwallacea similis]|uniref:uncharacterized protein n=1 Tax=Euwallacea similis TaxID=1736056 RepID=UPI003450D97E
MAPKLYGIPASPPVRAVLMCAKVLGVELQLVPVNLLAFENMEDSFLQKNPQHTVPLLEEEDGFCLADSHAIMAYLVSKYGKDDHLYPKDDHKKRAVIDHILHFDSSILFVRGLYISKQLLFQEVQPTKQQLDMLKEAFQILDKILEKSQTQYVAGNNVTIADFSIITSVTSWGFVESFQEFPNLKKYVEKFQKLPCYETNVEGLEMYKEVVVNGFRKIGIEFCPCVQNPFSPAPSVLPQLLTMPLKLYEAKVSPCVRSVMLTIEALGLKNVDFEAVDLFKGETETPEFQKINPLCKVPVLLDGDLTVWDSHAINAYLVNQYGADDSLYPKNPAQRALVDAMNQFDTGFLFAAHDDLIKSIVTAPSPQPLNPYLAKPLEEAYDLLEVILEGRSYVAGAHLTIADFSIATTLSSSTSYLKLSVGKHQRIGTWYQKMQALPYWERVNGEGLKKVLEVLGKKLIS